MTIDSSEALVAELTRTRLLEVPELDDIRQALPPQVADARDMARHLVEQRRITSYQAEQLLEGNGQQLVLGGYRILEPLGRGGMGQVFKAVQQRLDRVVALKVIDQECLSQSPDAVRRFQREARAAALLSHPNVITIYDAGQEDDTHFIAMEYVEGLDLSRLVDCLGPLPVAVACRFIGQAALGLQHAHERGMVHRDIKPSNLFVTQPPVAGTARSRLKPSGEDAAPATTTDAAQDLLNEGIVKVLDMGLALLVDDGGLPSNSAITQTGKVVGTPDYLAPEQARASRSVDNRADIYSLGCTFYHMLAGRPPFPNGTFLEKLLMHQLDEPEPVEKVRPDVPHAVAAVVRKMMAKSPEDRYQTPLAVAEAVQALAGMDGATMPLAGPTTASEPPSGSRSSISGFVSLQNVQALTDTPSNPQPVEETPTPSRRSPSCYNSWTGSKESAEARSAVKPARELAILKGHNGCVVALVFAPDRNGLASAGMDETIRLWDFSEGKPQDALVLSTPREEVTALAFTNDQTALIASTNRGNVWLWDLTVPDPKVKAVVKAHAQRITALAYSTDGLSLALGCADGTASLWDVSDGGLRQRATIRGHRGEVTAVGLASDGRMVATGGRDGTLRLWVQGRLWNRGQAALRVAPCPVASVAFSPDGLVLACGSLDQTFHLWDLTDETLRKRPQFSNSQGGVRLILFAPPGHNLVTLQGNKGRKCDWEVASGTLLQAWAIPVARVYSYALTYDGKYLATGVNDGQIGVFRVAPKETRH